MIFNAKFEKSSSRAEMSAFSTNNVYTILLRGSINNINSSSKSTEFHGPKQLGEDVSQPVLGAALDDGKIISFHR
jgi:hypothetical protein